MKYLIAALALVMVSTTSCADSAGQANDKQNAAAEQGGNAPAADNAQTSNKTGQGTAQGGQQIAIAPPEFLSAPQNQPHPVLQTEPSPLYSLSGGVHN